MTFTIWSTTFLINEPYMSYQRFKKGTFFEKKCPFFLYFCTLFAKNGLFAAQPPFFESLITHKWFIFEHSYIYHMVNVKRVVIQLLFKSKVCIWCFWFLICRQSQTGYFYCKGRSGMYEYVERNMCPIPEKVGAVKFFVFFSFTSDFFPFDFE